MSDVAPAPGEGGLPYHRLLRGGAWGSNGWWRPLVGVLVLAALVALVQALVFVGLAAYYAVEGLDADQAEDRLTGDSVTPSFLLAVNLGWALAIPAVWLVLRAFHRLRPRWLSSVLPRLRWRWMLVCFGLSFIALVATLVVSMFLPAQGTGEITTEPNEFTARTRDFVLVVLLFTPLQAAGEEYVFRGYLTQAFGGIFSSPRVAAALAVVVPAVLFALAHGWSQPAPVFVSRLAFGLVAGVLVIVTGGLEAAIAMHVVNNFLAFGIALAFSDMDSALNPTDQSWWSVVSTLTQSVVYTAIAAYGARQMAVRTTTGPGVLAGPAARV